MLDPKILRNNFIDYMGPIFESYGFLRSNIKSNIWTKTIEGGVYVVGVGFSIDVRIKEKPVFSFTLFLDTDDILDVRSYKYSGWPPKTITKNLGIKVSMFEKIIGSSYDAWIPFPDKNMVSKDVLENYAKYLIHDLETKTEKGKKWVAKTHRWDSV